MAGSIDDNSGSDKDLTSRSFVTCGVCSRTIFSQINTLLLFDLGLRYSKSESPVLQMATSSREIAMNDCKGTRTCIEFQCCRDIGSISKTTAILANVNSPSGISHDRLSNVHNTVVYNEQLFCDAAQALSQVHISNVVTLSMCISIYRCLSEPLCSIYVYLLSAL